MMRNIILALFCLCVVSSPAVAEDLQPFSGRVQVSVSASDTIKGKIESYLSRELRSLGDVVVTDDNPRWILSIVALESESKSGYKTGVELSVVILEPFNNQFVVNMVPEKSKDLVSGMTSSLYSYSGHWLRVGAPEDLRSICNGIIADFDSSELKEARDFWQMMIDYQESQKKKSPNK
ncbi:hypothetical protein [Shewanella algae]|uniref:hypothetical protein n=1 Tax=Shewanella algae TaxID=38313 RepID=UPI0011841267|nr:hypothetical protein [Shewanella algae]MBO2568535.1 hypothetical protein [Shewanella algae]MBO2661588.1 hypothetical protein [Shewanella algae]MBO2674212.1 hypothetical protein [Shewanella algae]MCL1054614.1 hypothetical protein [Shewanella algae]TVO84787.1 hypothetical protein AYI80_17980 [Shewanella algae]